MLLIHLILYANAELGCDCKIESHVVIAFLNISISIDKIA